jgi:Methyltransferase domain
MNRTLHRAAAHFGSWNRARKSRWLADFIASRDIRSLLLVGVGPGKLEWENQVERRVATLVEWAVWTGQKLRSATESGRWEVTYLVSDGLALPFADHSFDLVFSNAVVEHVGDATAQRRFLREHARVGRHWVATTPNRWFPVEPHTAAVFKHWSPAWRAGRSEFTRLLSRSEFVDVSPSGGTVVGSLFAPTYTLYGAARAEYAMQSTR